MILDNTQYVRGGGVSVKTPVTQLRQMGYARTLMGLGSTLPLPGNVQTGETGFDFSGLLTAFNAEALYLTNLERARRGLAPLSPSTYQPGVNVGIDPNTLLLVGAGVLAIVLLAGRRT